MTLGTCAVFEAAFKSSAVLCGQFPASVRALSNTDIKHNQGLIQSAGELGALSITEMGERVHSYCVNDNICSLICAAYRLSRGTATNITQARFWLPSKPGDECTINILVHYIIDWVRRTPATTHIAWDHATLVDSTFINNGVQPPSWNWVCVQVANLDRLNGLFGQAPPGAAAVQAPWADTAAGWDAQFADIVVGLPTLDVAGVAPPVVGDLHRNFDAKHEVAGMLAMWARYSNPLPPTSRHPRRLSLRRHQDPARS